jgi:ribose transport system permease protein
MSTPTAPPDEPVAAGEPAEEAPPTRWQRIASGSSTQIGLILLGLIAIFAILEPTEFFDVPNARNIATDAAVLLVLAVGSTYVIITAGIDLSLGSVLVFSGVVAAKAMNGIGGDNWDVILIGFAIALLGGLAWGLLNGFLVAKAKIPAFIVTLGTLGMSLGAAYLITGGVDEREVPFKLVNAGIGRIIGIPYLVLISIAVAIVFGIVLAQTRFGRYTYAVGSNEEAVRRAGVNVDRHLIKIYALAACCPAWPGS